MGEQAREPELSGGEPTAGGAGGATGTGAGVGAEASAALAEARRLLEVDVALARAGVVDLEAGRLLVGERLRQQPGLDVAGAVAQVREGRGYLFGAAALGGARPAGGAASAPSARGSAEEAAAQEAAQRVRQTGDRRALLSYLRLRRR